jgi:hypothetical protein
VCIRLKQARRVLRLTGLSTHKMLCAHIPCLECVCECCGLGLCGAALYAVKAQAALANGWEAKPLEAFHPQTLAEEQVLHDIGATDAAMYAATAEHANVQRCAVLVSVPEPFVEVRLNPVKKVVEFTMVNYRFNEGRVQACMPTWASPLLKAPAINVDVAGERIRAHEVLDEVLHKVSCESRMSLDADLLQAEDADVDLRVHFHLARRRRHY